jgi:hypothetical protein
MRRHAINESPRSFAVDSDRRDEAFGVVSLYSGGPAASPGRPDRDVGLFDNPATVHEKPRERTQTAPSGRGGVDGRSMPDGERNGAQSNPIRPDASRRRIDRSGWPCAKQRANEPNPPPARRSGERGGIDGKSRANEPNPARHTIASIFDFQMLYVDHEAFNAPIPARTNPIARRVESGESQRSCGSRSRPFPRKRTQFRGGVSGLGDGLRWGHSRANEPNLERRLPRS